MINNFLQNDFLGAFAPFFLFQEKEMLNFIINFLSENANFYKAFHELNSLRDEDLEELGLNRYEIPITIYNSILQKYK